MIQRITLSVLLLFIGMALFAQKNSTVLSFGVFVPIGNFSSTHFIGTGASILFCPKGKDTLKTSSARLVFESGMSYFQGRKEIISGHSYTYPGYFVIFSYAGAGITLSKKWDCTIQAGPSLGIYNGSVRFVVGTSLRVEHSVTKIISAGPVISLLKESGANAIWFTGLKARFKI